MFSYTNFWKKLYLTALGVFLAEEILRHSCYTAFAATDLLCKALMVFSCSVVLLKLSIAFFQGKIPLLELSVMAALTAYCLLLVLQNRSGVFFFLILFSAGGFDVDFEQIVQFFLVSLTVSILLIILSCYTGIIEETCLYRDLDGKLLHRWSLGFHYYYEASHYVFFLILIWIYCRKNRISWMELTLLFLLNWLVYSRANTKSPFYLSSVAILLDALNRLVPTPHNYKKIHAATAICIYPLCCLSLILFTKYADPQEGIWREANKLVSGRLALNLKAYQAYGYNLLGNTITWSTGSDYTLVDSSYLTCLFEYGFFFLLILMAVWILLGYFSSLRKDFWYAFVSVFIALYSIFDNFLLRPECNVFLLAFPYINTAAEELRCQAAGGMKSVTKIRLSYILEDLWNHRRLCALILCLCMAGSLFYGNRNLDQTASLEEKKEAQNYGHYTDLLASYEGDLAEKTNALVEQRDNADSLRESTETAALMKFSPDQVYASTIQYLLTYGEGTDSSNVNQLLLDFIKGDSFRAGIEAAPDLEGSNGEGIINAAINNKILTVTLKYYDAEKSSQVISILQDRIENQLSSIIQTCGEFTLSEAKITHLETADTSILKTQNERFSSLRESVASQASKNSSVVAQKVLIDSFRKNNAEELSAAAGSGTAFSSKKALLKYAIFGLILGFGLCGLADFWRYVWSDIVLRAGTLSDSPCRPLAVIREDSMTPSPELMSIVLGQSASTTGEGRIFLQDLSGGTAKKGFLIDSLEKNGLCINYVDNNEPDRVLLDKLIGSDCCLFLIQTGVTRFSELKKAQELCNRYQVCLLGSVVVE